MCEFLSTSVLYKNCCSEANDIVREVVPPFGTYLILREDKLIIL